MKKRYFEIPLEKDFDFSLRCEECGNKTFDLFRINNDSIIYCGECLEVIKRRTQLLEAEKEFNEGRGIK